MIVLAKQRCGFVKNQGEHLLSVSVSGQCPAINRPQRACTPGSTKHVGSPGAAPPCSAQCRRTLRHAARPTLAEVSPKSSPSPGEALPVEEDDSFLSKVIDVRLVDDSGFLHCGL